MNQTFVPHNDLETRLVEAQEGRLDGNVFMMELLDQQLFMPVEDEREEIQGFQRSSKARPLTLESEEGFSVLVLFTSPDRAKPFLQDYPDYRGGLLSEFGWILERIGSGVAISINPGLEVGMDLDPDSVAQLIQANAARQQQGQASS
ncbi:MAG TPA: SseB family protein [Gammaproteobacteria bacterium]|nr:SseB family protein [Gammaproteobacteria bacterium]